MIFSFNKLSAESTFTATSKFVLAVNGDFRGGQLKVLFRVDSGSGEYFERQSKGEDVFSAPDVRAFDYSGDVKLLWEGDAGEVYVQVFPAGSASLLVDLATELSELKDYVNQIQSHVEEINAGSINAAGFNRYRVEPLSVPSIGRTIAVTTTQAGQQLTAQCRRVSLVAVGCAMRFRVGTSSVGPLPTDHLIQQGERIDIAVPASATPWINVVRDAAATTNGTLNISELVLP